MDDFNFIWILKHQGPVVHNFVSLTSSLRHQLVKQIHCYFLLIKCESSLHSKVYNSVFAIFMFEILTNCYLTMLLILNKWPQNMIEFISRILVLAAEVFRISYIAKEYQIIVIKVEMLPYQTK